VIPYGRAKYYDDILTISNAGEWLRVVNEVNIDKYVAGVVKSEVGTNEGLELYKVQAIICRTYALSNFRKHEEEDFQLCDKVHCQVFGGSCDQANAVIGVAYAGNNAILRAAVETSGLVLVDTTLELITASFHSNCGGQTCNSEDVWILPKLYLKSVKDPYCVQRKNARWEREVSQVKWLDYFERVHGYRTGDEQTKQRVLNFTQTSRAPYFQNNRDIWLKEVRSDWRFRSTFFSTHVSGDQVVVQGRGFGHGVGLCQEGAMEMALRGITHKDILNFYYTEVALIDIASLRFLLR
jgi:stage II sporulation protein D